MERLQKVMAHAGIASRRKSEEIIAQGRVKVNGKVITTMGEKVDPQKDTIEVDGKVISKEKRIYLLLNKPTGYVSTVDDPRGRKTVLDLVGNISQRIYPAGRLDYDTSGLLILTNDGDLTYILTHPSFKVDKTYLVEVKGKVKPGDLNRLNKGIKLEDGMTVPSQTKLISSNSGTTNFVMTIHEGRNRQVRRMCKKIGYQVKNLKRIGIGFLKIDELSEGEYRHLTDEEIEKFKNLK